MSTKVEDMVRQFDVVAEATVGPSREEANGMRSSSVTFGEVLRGPATGTVQRVFWGMPDGKSCHMTNLEPGRWLLFLSWAPDGHLVVTRCDDKSSRLRSDASARQKLAKLRAHLAPVQTEADAVNAAALAVRRMLLAALAAPAVKDSLATQPGALDLALVDRAIVKAEPDGAFLVRWFQNPPAGYAVDAEVRVLKSGVTQVVRANASFSPD